MNDSQPLIEKHIEAMEGVADRFTLMADRIIKNKEDQFGGAFVIVPPADGGAPIETLVLDANQDPAQFWAILKTKADIMLGQLDALARNQNAGFPRR